MPFIYIYLVWFISFCFQLIWDKFYVSTSCNDVTENQWCDFVRFFSPRNFKKDASYALMWTKSTLPFSEEANSYQCIKKNCCSQTLSLRKRLSGSPPLTYTIVKNIKLFFHVTCSWNIFPLYMKNNEPPLTRKQFCYYQTH